MDSAVFNSLLQLGYFWTTLVVMCALYTGIYRVALRLHRESAARRRNAAAVTAHTTQHLGPTSSTASTSCYKRVATATVSAACNHAHRDDVHQTGANVAACLSDSSLSEHDVTTRHRENINDVTLLLPVPVNVMSSPRHAEIAIELQEMTRLDTTSTGMTFTIDDDDIRFADDVTEDDDDVIVRDRQVVPTSENDVNLRHYHHHHPQKQQQPSDAVSSRHYASGSLLSPAPQDRDMYRHSVEYRELSRIDTASKPTRRRFCGHRRLSSRRRQRRSTCEWHTSSQVIDELSGRLCHFTRHTTHSLSSRHVPCLSAKVTAGHPRRPLRIMADSVDYDKSEHTAPLHVASVPLHTLGRTVCLRTRTTM